MLYKTVKIFIINLKILEIKFSLISLDILILCMLIKKKINTFLIFYLIYYLTSVFSNFVSNTILPSGSLDSMCFGKIGLFASLNGY